MRGQLAGLYGFYITNFCRPNKFTLQFWTRTACFFAQPPLLHLGCRLMGVPSGGAGSAWRMSGGGRIFGGGGPLRPSWPLRTEQVNGTANAIFQIAKNRRMKKEALTGETHQSPNPQQRPLPARIRNYRDFELMQSSGLGRDLSSLSGLSFFMTTISC